MKLSARNQFSGTVTNITQGQAMAEVTVKVGNLEVVAAITEGSVKSMGLKVNDSVTVAVIEDDKLARTALALWLEEAGSRVFQAASQREMLELLCKAQIRPDFIIADYRLGSGKNGVEAIAALRRKYGAVPAVIISGERDLIVEIGNRLVRNSSDLRTRLGLATVGDTLDLRVVRGNQERRVQMRVSEVPAATGGPAGAESIPLLAGASVANAERTAGGQEVAIPAAVWGNRDRAADPRAAGLARCPDVLWPARPPASLSPVARCVTVRGAGCRRRRSAAPQEPPGRSARSRAARRRRWPPAAPARRPSHRTGRHPGAARRRPRR